jgi:8-oxo-dGTP pyrophosphatase MutT (NUDIX family)
MVAVFDDAGRVLLIRHTYGNRQRWDFPGGWVQGGEPGIEAARREALEEIGLELDLEPVGAVDADWDHKHEHLEFFAARFPPGATGRFDPVEIAEVGWFDPAEPPPVPLGQGSLAVLRALQAGEYPRDRA